MLFWQKHLNPRRLDCGSKRHYCAVLEGLLLILALGCAGQDRLKTMPGYERFEKMAKEIPSAVQPGALSVTWKEEGKAFEYQIEGKRFHYDVEARIAVEVSSESRKTGTGSGTSPRRDSRRRSEARARGRQFTSAIAPDGKLKAFYRDRNLWLSDADGSNEFPVTSEGNEKSRVKYGNASWVYGEELDQTTAMWWSGDSQKIAFYRFDESAVADYYVTLGNTNIQNTLYAEAYPKAGAPNPVVELQIYDIRSKAMIKVDVRSDKSFENSVPGHYVYGIGWTSNNTELLFHRTDRLQKVMEFCAADVESGKTRVIIREEWPASWVENSPEIRFLKDGRRFIWASERTGWKNYYLYSLTGELLMPLTRHEFEVAEIVRIVEDPKSTASKDNCLFYMARDGQNPLQLQLHRVSLDGSNHQRLTDPRFHHAVDVAPDARHFIDVAQNHDHPPFTSLCNAEGTIVAEVRTSDISKFRKLGLKPVELFQFKAADGQTDLYGMLHFPSNFSPRKKYPLLVTVYAGPATSGASERFTLPSVLTELGFLVASFDSRSASGRGKAKLDAIYQNLGRVEIDDQAAGVKFLGCRPYVDKGRVGIFGTSYGGTASLLCLMRYPGVFQAACSCSPVTDFRNYDSVYTERYLGLPQESCDAYDAVSSMRYVDNLKGKLMLFFGTADDNVHPANSLQLIRALQHAGKSFELQVGPDAGHTSVNRDRMMEFFIQSLRSN